MCPVARGEGAQEGEERAQVDVAQEEMGEQGPDPVLRNAPTRPDGSARWVLFQELFGTISGIVWGSVERFV